LVRPGPDTRLGHPVRRRPAPTVEQTAARAATVKKTLTPVRTLAVRAGVCSACPGRRRAGWLVQLPTDRARLRILAIPGPERPRRRQTNCGPGLALRPSAAAGPRAQFPAGRPPAALINLSSALSSSRRPPMGFSNPRQPMGVGLAGPSRVRPGRPGAPIGGACGPFRAALKPYRKFSQISILAGGRPVAGSQPRPRGASVVRTTGARRWPSASR
jgi:hypothetical protein